MRNAKRALVAGIALIFLLFNGQAMTADSALQDVSELKEITYQKVDNQLQINIKILGKFSFEVFELPLNRLVINFSSVEKISCEPSLQINDVGVLSARVGQFQPKVARLVFELDEKIPFHRITQVEDGLKVIFWLEEAAALVAPPAEIKEEKKEEAAVEETKAEVKEPEKKEELKEAKETEETKAVPKEQPKEEAAEEVGKGFFLQVGGGFGIPVSPTTETQKDLNLYGEVGYLKESYKLSTAPIVELIFGRYFEIAKKDIKVGLGFGYYEYKYKETSELSVPHPFVPNNPRTVSFEDNLKNKLYNFYLYGLWPLIEKDKFVAGIGPILGFSAGRYTSLQDISIEDNPPFGSTDVTITSRTNVDDTISNLWFGGLVNLEYLISQKVSLNLDWRVISLSPNVKNLAKNASLSQAQLVLGIKYNF